MSITRQKFRYLVVLFQKFLTQLASGLSPQIDQVLSHIGITMINRAYIPLKIENNVTTLNVLIWY